MRGSCWLLALVLAGAMLHSACAETTLYLFTLEDVPQALRWGVMEEPKGETVVTLTFGGDCTLGGETHTRRHRNSFASKVAAGGMGYPFAGLQELFATDDFTLVNLEGVLGDSPVGKMDKEFNFLGDAAYSAILTEGSVECVNLANNHTMDFGFEAYAAMLRLLGGADIGYVNEDTLCILEKDGVRIGLTASLFSMPPKKQEKLKKQMTLLKELNCGAIIHSMHAGVEYAAQAGARQKQMARAAVECGAALVVGHHPHVVQNVELVNGVPVVYSLGNNSFGGNFNPADKDALLLRAAFRFEDGGLKALDWTLHPIAVSGAKSVNDYQPVLLEGEEARRVIQRVADQSSLALAPYQEGVGARQMTIVYKGQEDDQYGYVD